MRHASLRDLNAIYKHLRSHRDVFPHVRQDKLRREIEAGQVIYQDGVVIVWQQYKKKTRVGEVDIPKGAIMLHQILNSDQFNGAGSKVFRQFVDKVVKRSGGDLYLTVRKENTIACQFYERNGMTAAGMAVWKKRTIPGVVYKLSQTKIRQPH